MSAALVRLRFVRALMVAVASLVMLGLALPGQAQAAVSAPSSVALQSRADQSSDDYPYECFGYKYDHGSQSKYHYYQYCYDWKYKSEDDWHNDRHWYSSYWLYYWYYDNNHRWRYGSCHWNHDFGYSHSGAWKKYCDNR